MIKREEDIQKWIYEVCTIGAVETWKIPQTFQDYGDKGWECFCVTEDKDNVKTLYFKKPNVNFEEKPFRF